ncbi:MAG TPA: hypothetical protein VGB85_09080 [Nannocystis sp.]|jgi:hypothetical protein
MTEIWNTLRYRGPHGRNGRVELTLWSDHRARLNSFVAQPVTPAVVQGVLTNWVVPELFENLHAAGFPDLPKNNAGRVALLSVAGKAGMVQAWLAPTHGANSPMARAVYLLEGVAHALSGGTLSSFRTLERPVLAEALPGPP